MHAILKIVICSLALITAATIDVFAQADHSAKTDIPHYCECSNNYLDIDSSESLSPGEKVLKTGFIMTQVNKKVVKGSCWDFVNQVYRSANIAELKETVFHSKKSGPYAPSTLVQPGDWIYHINHQYKSIEHSAIFVCWKDFEKKIAITLSYAGMNRSIPGKYGEYNLESIYSIFRPIDSNTK